MDKPKLMVEAICDGTVLDHIPSNKLFNIVSLLELDKSTDPITIGNNLDSRQVGSKGIIKISNRFFSEEEICRIAILAPSIHLNTIRNYEVISKTQIRLPKRVCGLIRCSNHKCITNAENIPSNFIVSKVAEDKVLLNCHYCGRSIKGEDCELI